MKVFNPYKMFHGAFIPNCLLEYDGLTFAAKCLWAKLVQYAGENGYCWPKRDTLAKELGTSLDKIKRTLRELRQCGFLVTKQVGGTGAPNAYFFVEHDIFRRGRIAPPALEPDKSWRGKSVPPLYSKEKNQRDSKNYSKKPRRTKAPGEVTPTVLTIQDETLPSVFLENTHFMEMWETFKQYRKDIGSPIKTGNIASHLVKLSNDDPALAVSIIQQTLDNEWRGLFELKGDWNGANKQTAPAGKYGHLANNDED